MQTIATNKKANFNYFIKEKFEAGLVLTGDEVKSLRVNTGSIKESYIAEKLGELWLTNCYIKNYSYSNKNENNPIREKKIKFTWKMTASESIFLCFWGWEDVNSGPHKDTGASGGFFEKINEN